MIDNNRDYRAYRTIVYHLVSACNEKINSLCTVKDGKQFHRRRHQPTINRKHKKKKGGERERDREIERERECERDTHRDHGWDIEYVKKRLGEHCQRDGTETNERTNEEQEKIQKRPIHVTDTCGSHKKQST